MYIESRIIVRDLQLAYDEVAAFTGAIARIEQLGDRIAMHGVAQILSCTVRLTVDRKDLEARLPRFAADKAERRDLRRQRERIVALEERIAELTRQIGRLSGQQADAARRERNLAASELTSLHDAIRSWQERVATQKRLHSLVHAYVKIGMTQQEVVGILGDPAERKRWPWGWEDWYYGDSKDRVKIGFDRRRFVRKIVVPPAAR